MNEDVQPPHRRRRWRMIGFGLFAIVSYPVWLAADWWFLPSRPMIEADKVETITITTRTRGESKPTIIVTKSTDKHAIEAILKVVSSAERTSDHKCGSSVKVQIQNNDGTQTALRFLPGHDEKFYEYRYESRINRVDREQFLSAMRLLGVKKLPLDAQGEAESF